MEGTYPVLVTWGFEQRTGKVELEVFLDLTKENAASEVSHVYTRAQFTRTNVALIHLPDGAGRDDLEKWVEFTPKEELLDKLNRAEVKKEQIVRRKNEAGNALDFILSK